MKKRKLLAVVGLSIITLGIYDLYWLFVTKRELNKKVKTHVPPIFLLFIPLIFFIVCLILLLVNISSSTANNLSSSNNSFNFNDPNSFSSVNNQQFTNATNTVNTGIILYIVLYIISTILWFGLSFYWIFKFSKAIDEYTNGKMSKGETFALLWILHPFGVLLIQDTFNDMVDNGEVPSDIEDSGHYNTPPPSAPVAQPPAQPPITPTAGPAPMSPPAASMQPSVVAPSPAPAMVSGASQPAIVVSPEQPAAPTPVVVQ